MITDMNKVECSLLGMIIHEGNQYARAVGMGMSNLSFFDDKNRQIWDAFGKLEQSGQQIDLPTVGALVSGGEMACRLIECMELAPVCQNFDWYVTEVLSGAMRRGLALELSALAQEVGNFTPGDNHEQPKLKLQQLTDKYCGGQSVGRKSLTIKEIASNYLEELEQRIIAYNSGQPRGIGTGFKELNAVLAGWMPGGLYIVAARTSLGKTTLALNFADTALIQGKKTMFFTNEMPAGQIFEKHLSLCSKVYNSRLFSGNLQEEQIEKLTGTLPKLLELPFTINDWSGRTIEQFEAQIRAKHRSGGVDFVIMDYIQQMRVGSRNMENRVGELGLISTRMKELALELKIPILALAQVNRQAEKSDEPPSLANIRDSGSIEQEADAVIFIHRKREDDSGECELVVAKNRFGKVGSITIHADLAINKFRER